MNEFGILHLKDEKFNVSESREMQLLIKIAPGHISYAIIHQKDNQLLVLFDSPIHQSIELTLNDILQSNEYLRSSFAVVKVAVQSFNFTLIPSQYYTKDDIPGYEKLVQANEGTKTFISTINVDAIKCIIALDLEVTAPFISTFSQLKLQSQVNPLIEAGLKITAPTNQKLILQINTESFEAYYSVDDKLVFYNIFKISNVDDFNYFVLLMIKQCAIDTHTTSVYLAGEIEAGDVYFERADKYFVNVDFADSSKIVSIPEEFNHIKNHKYFSLLGLFTCE